MRNTIKNFSSCKIRKTDFSVISAAIEKFKRYSTNQHQLTSVKRLFFFLELVWFEFRASHL
jgi:hypothetical protein